MTKLCMYAVFNRQGNTVASGPHRLPCGIPVRMMTWHVDSTLDYVEKKWCSSSDGITFSSTCERSSKQHVSSMTNGKVPHGPIKWCHVVTCQWARWAKIATNHILWDSICQPLVNQHNVLTIWVMESVRNI